MKSDLTITEQNYVKHIYALSEGNHKKVLTSDLAAAVHIKAATATEMLLRLSDKKLVVYEKYYGAVLTEKGKLLALNIIRKHRLWEVFLADKLKFSWDEVHEMAEHLEHATTDELSNRLENYLGFPKTDPHGDPIPDKRGEIKKGKTQRLSEIQTAQLVEIKSVDDQDPVLLRYLMKHQLVPGTKLTVKNIFSFDQSLEIKINNKTEMTISQKIAHNLWIATINP